MGALPEELISAHITNQIDNHLRERVEYFNQELGVKPGLAIVSNNPDYAPSQKYIGIKLKVAQQLGMHALPAALEAGADLRTIIEGFNGDERFHGIIVQLPLLSTSGERAFWDEESAVIDKIAPEKDVDGLGSDTVFSAATPLAIFRLLEGNNISYLGMPTAVIGRGKLVGEPFYREALRRGMDVRAFDEHSDRDEVKAAMNESTLIVTATGKHDVINPEDFVAPHPRIVVDAGGNEQTGNGDLSDAMRAFAAEHGWTVSARKGGVGPLTVRMLLSNTVEAAFLQASTQLVKVPEQRRESIELAPPSTNNKPKPWPPASHKFASLEHLNMPWIEAELMAEKPVA